MRIIGSNKSDLLSGTDLSDVIYGNGGRDYIFANGSNILSGTAREQIFGGKGDDFIGGFSLKLDDIRHSPSYASSIDGGDGHDTLFLGISSGSENITLAKAGASLRVQSVETTIYCVDAVDKQRILGTDRSDTIVVSDAKVRTDADGGNDYIFAKGGNDVINGGAGNDFISAGEGHNIVSGGKGSDYFHFYFEEEVREYTEITDFQHGVDKFVIQYRNPETADVDYPYDNENPTFGEAHQFVNFDEGREIGRGTFRPDAGFFSRNVVFEQETGSVLLGNSLIAHIDGNAKLTESDFLFAYA